MSSFSVSQQDDNSFLMGCHLSNDFTTTYYDSIIIEAQSGSSPTTHLTEEQLITSGVLIEIRDAGHLMAYRQSNTHPDGDFVSFDAPMSDIGGEMTLSPGTTYTSKAWAVASNGCAYEIGSYQTQTTEWPTLDTPTLNYATSDENSITIHVNAVSNATHYYGDVFEGGSYLFSVDSSSTTLNITGLDSSTTYKIYVYATAYHYEDSNILIVNKTTSSLPQLSDPTASSITSTANSITVDMNTVSGANTYYLEV